MTTADKRNRALRKARKAAALERQRRHRREARHVEDFYTWLGMESRAYNTLRAQRSQFGERSQEATDAEVDWRDVLALRPIVPPDSAFRRARGDVEETAS